MAEIIFGAETRECNKCIHHTSGMCDSWVCKMQTVEGLKKEVREKTIEEFAEILHGREFGNAYGTNIVLTPKEIDEIAKELKGE